MPAAAADSGCKLSPASTRAQISWRRVASARAVSMKLVRPEDARPKISVRAPRGKPPVSASMEEMPLDTIAGAGRTSSREPGTTPWGSSSSRLRPGSGKGPGKGMVSGGKEARITAEGIRDLGIRLGTGDPAYFAFCSPSEILRRQAGVVKCDARPLMAFGLALFPERPGNTVIY